MWTAKPKIDDLEKVIYNFENPLREVKIGVIGKYTELVESYKSLAEALNHGALFNQLKLSLVYIDSENIKDYQDAKNKLAGVQGILVPGGFGERGTEGKIFAIKYAREEKKPFLGICLGLQLALIEFARNVAGITNATSEEFEKEGEKVIHYLTGQSKEGTKGASMRLVPMIVR